MAKTKKKLFFGIDKFLRENFGEKLSQGELAKIINENQSRYSNSLKDDCNLCANALYKYMRSIYELGKKDGVIEGRRQNAENLFQAIYSIHGFENDAVIAKKLILGKNQNARTTSLSKYRNGITTISKNQYKNILGKHSSKIFRAILEFCECTPHKTGSTWKLFKDQKEETKIKNKLSDTNGTKVGVYAMYDSAGRIIYFGKTTKGLYKEIVQRLNAVVHRDVVLCRNGNLKHVGYSTKNSIRVGSMTKYISAVEVLAPEAISNIEAFVLRLIPNDDVNYKIENYDD